MKFPRLSHPSLLLSIVLAFCTPAALASGGGNGNHRGRGGSNISVTISPTSYSLQTGQNKQFTASVSGTSNTGLNWLVNGIAGGNATVGTVSSSGLYTAPAAVPSSSVKVTAQSVAVSSASASAAVTITSTTPPVAVSVTVSPGSATLNTGNSQAFSATVSGTSNTAVNWMVNGVAGGNSTLGTISSSGMYTAPAAVPANSILVQAQSAAQSTAIGSASVSVVLPAISVSISPTNVILQVGKSQQFSASVSGTTNTAVNWLVSGVLGGNISVGTISSSGLYTAPASVSAAQITVTAQSTANVNSYASTNVTVTQPVQHSVSLSWTDSTTVAGYNIYRGAQAAGPFSKLNSSLDTATVYTDGTVVSGQTYYYVTTAVNASGVESAYSNVAQAVIP